MLFHGDWWSSRGLVGIVGYFGDGGKVVVLMVLMTNVRLAVVIMKNSFIYMLHGCGRGDGSGNGVNSGCGSSCLAHHHHHHHPTTTTQYTLDFRTLTIISFGQ